MLKIAHLFWGLRDGGIETMLVHIANEQVLQGAEVSIIIINDLVAEEHIKRLDSNVKVVMLKRPIGSKSLSFVKRLNHSLDEMSPNIIHLHHSVIYNYLAKRWIKSDSCSICSTLHDMPYGTCGSSLRVFRILQNILLGKGGNVMNSNRVDCVYAISKSVKSALKDKFSVDSIVVNNGICTSLFHTKEINKISDDFRIVQVSRLDHYKKGQDLIIRVIKRLVSAGVNCHLTLIGDGDSQDYLETLVKELELHRNVSFLGMKTQDFLMNHLCDFDLLVQPSRFEGFGLTVAEAMAASVPVLVSSGQGPAEVTQNERYGWVFENGDEESLYERLNHIIINYNQCLDKARVARDYVINNYDVKVTSNRYLSEYKRLLNME